MLYELNIDIVKSNNYCNNYIKKLIDKYIYLFITSKYNNLSIKDKLYNNLSIKDKLNENIYLIDYYDNITIDIIIEELLLTIEKHIKNIYPDCGSKWKLNFNYTKVLSN